MFTPVRHFDKGWDPYSEFDNQEIVNRKPFTLKEDVGIAINQLDLPYFERLTNLVNTSIGKINCFCNNFCVY